MKLTFTDVLALLGIIETVFILGIFIHEYGHYYMLKQKGISIKEFVVLGWRENFTDLSSLNNFAWVEPKNYSYDRTPHKLWDLNFSFSK